MELGKGDDNVWTGGLGTIISTGDQQGNAVILVVQLEGTKDQNDGVQVGMLIHYEDRHSLSPSAGELFECHYSNENGKPTYVPFRKASHPYAYYAHAGRNSSHDCYNAGRVEVYDYPPQNGAELQGVKIYYIHIPNTIHVRYFPEFFESESSGDRSQVFYYEARYNCPPLSGNCVVLYNEYQVPKGIIPAHN